MTLFLFFFNDTATTEIYTLSLHDALPIYQENHLQMSARVIKLPDGHNAVEITQAKGNPEYIGFQMDINGKHEFVDRKSTRLNSSHQIISYAVFCLKSEKHTSELQSPDHLVCRLLLEKEKADL